MKKLLLLLAAMVFMVGCTDAPTTTRVLQQNGYKDITITGYRYFECGDDYTFHTGFSATNIVTNQRVTGAVCSGFLKGNSIKLD